MNNSVPLSGWWRIGIVLCVVGGLFGYAIGTAANRMTFTQTFPTAELADDWQPESGDCVPGTLEKMINLTIDSGSLHDRTFTCDRQFGFFYAIFDATVGVGIVAAACGLLGWIVAGFRSRLED